MDSCLLQIADGLAVGTGSAIEFDSQTGFDRGLHLHHGLLRVVVIAWGNPPVAPGVSTLLGAFPFFRSGFQQSKR